MPRSPFPAFRVESAARVEQWAPDGEGRRVGRLPLGPAVGLHLRLVAGDLPRTAGVVPAEDLAGQLGGPLGRGLPPVPGLDRDVRAAGEDVVQVQRALV